MPASAIAARVLQHTRQRGAVPVAAACLSWGTRWALGRARAGRPWTATVRHEGTEHRLLRHPYHWTWLNERAVEVPLAEAVLDAAPAAHGPAPRVLEVGNVLSHYRPVTHDVVDKYERAPGVRNADVVDLDGDGRYDLVLAISTLEHVGFDEEPRDPGKAARAVRRLHELLAPGGHLWATVPVGYNPDLDEALRTGALPFSRLTALRATGPGARWEQVPVEEVWGTPYDWLLYTARAVVVAESFAGPPAGAGNGTAAASEAGAGPRDA
ncbi:class I SAM-dependent methyltransferase [Geodermatophilus sp. SYSU D01106]